MQFGVNYTPRRGWFHSWLHPDLGATREDFAQLADLGLDHVRIFPLWPLLQPSPNAVSAAAISDLVDVCQEANRAGLQFSVDILQGHLSSFDFLPSWTQTWHHRNLFSDPLVVSSQQLLARELAAAIKPIPGATGLCVGNEFPQFAASRHPDQSRINPAQARDWLSGMLGQMKQVWPEGEHVHCFDDDLLFVDDHPFTPPLTAMGDLATVHAWIFAHVGRHYGKSAPQLAAFPRYVCEVVAAWSKSERIWLQEVGAPLNYLQADEAAAFTERACDYLLADPLPGLERITWWCSYDVSRSLQDFPPVEYDLGLFDEHGKLKPVGEAYQRVLQTYRNQSPLPPRPRPALSLQLQPDFSDRSRSAADAELFSRWYEAAKAGQIPALNLHTGAGSGPEN